LYTLFSFFFNFVSLILVSGFCFSLLIATDRRLFTLNNYQDYFIWPGGGLVGWFGLMVFNATFNTISVISWRSVLLVEETGESGEHHRPVASH
jgi:hypothetical protein